MFYVNCGRYTRTDQRERCDNRATYAEPLPPTRRAR
ncbi:hypothetical protein Ae168Ps1_6371c [Pseudonocardia sp. Ae168_Ps1]|nr:hypothetical protein Ae150APs1_6196 [Pseudonocardia sp. Ae150A_Ps1]OLL70134.1 hypothetical protein Ae168Ps1_6371c [Pseudonocardia sp. Ae168_Ps1]OLL70405.1 hypothetical protein Ae263Ps1_6349c [Pseudonocardia sp. Ae263_Ps1]OLL89186.1 hypothetical protein Ae356Ps1_6214c [Pseudonocardia sp. Ae356_Ps1]